MRLPRAFRVDAGEVRIRRRGRAIVLEPVPESWEWLDALAGNIDGDFVSEAEEPGVVRSRNQTGRWRISRRRRVAEDENFAPPGARIESERVLHRLTRSGYSRSDSLRLHVVLRRSRPPG